MSKNDLALAAIQDDELLSYIPAHVLLDIARVMRAGCDKEGRVKGDWVKGTRKGQNIGAANRHLAAAADNGNFSEHINYDYTNTDNETGELHLAHAAARLIMAIHQIKLKPQWGSANGTV